MEFEDYLEFFNPITKIKKEDIDYITVQVKSIENKEDKEWEFSIEWEEWESQEKGIIKGINSSSIWALKSCSWYDEECEECD